MTRRKADDSPTGDPVRTIRMPLCYTCGVVLPQPGYCGNCLGQMERDLREFSLGHTVPAHPKNAECGVYNGVNCLWVNGYWVNTNSAPDWVKARVARKETELTPEKRAELEAEHAQVREALRKHEAQQEAVSF